MSKRSVYCDNNQEEQEADEFEQATEAVETSGAIGSAPRRTQARAAALAGAASLLAIGVALLCASRQGTSVFVWPLSAAGLVIGIVAIALALCAKRKERRLWLPILGAFASFVAFTSAWLFPSLLGPTFALYCQPSPPPVLRAVPLKGTPAGAAESTDWVDAESFALQRGEFRVEVISVALGQPPEGKEKEDKKAAPSKNVLLVRVRVHTTAMLNGDDHQGSVFERSAARRPKLYDQAGTSYELRDIQLLASVGDKRRASLFPVTVFDEVFVFQPPPVGANALKLELPCVAAVGADWFRFTIQMGMNRQPNDSPKLNPQR
jgi:hypothetical protein